MQFIERIQLCNFLSFAPDSDAFDMQPLNVLIGPNGSGKSNFIEAFELLRATPTDFATAVREGGGAEEWLWKGETPRKPAMINVETGGGGPGRQLRYRLEFTSVNSRVEVLDETIEETKPFGDHREPYFYYRFDRGRPVINVKNQEPDGEGIKRQIQREDLAPDQSVLAQRKDSELYPEITWIGQQFSKIQPFREWTFGRYAALRQAQKPDLPEDRLLPDSRNLALILNQIEHKDGRRFNELLKRFFPRFERMSTLVHGGTVQFYLHEKGFSGPIPATRLSDGTIRFMAILATLLNPSPPPLACIEEPELGMHPDAVALIAELLIEASERMQIIVTTHSEALVAAMSSRPESVVACERVGAGTKLFRLNPEELKASLQDGSLGDLWRMGEIGANP